MMRQAIRGLVLLAALAGVVHSTGRAQNAPDKVTVRDRKDGSAKTVEGLLKVSPAGFQVFGGEKFDKAVATAAPDDLLKVVIGDLPGVDRQAVLALQDKEGKKTTRKDLEEARTGYQALAKAAAGQARSKRYLDFKVALLSNKIVDDLDPAEGWKEKAEEAVKGWNGFLTDHATGWELWPAVRAATRLQIELGRYDDAARAWGKLAKSAELPPDAKLEAAIQEIDLQIRAGKSANAAVTAGELFKTAAGAKKDRLAIYEIAAKAANDGKPVEGVEKIKAEMNKTKDAGVHATGFSMLGELYLAAGKPRDAVWEFAMVETVLNQDRDDAFKAMCRLAELFDRQMDEDQKNKYREKLKRFRATF